MHAPSAPSLSAAGGHSAQVEIWLCTPAGKFKVAQTSETAIKITHAATIPAGEAILETIVDGRLHRRAIQLPSAVTEPGWIPVLAVGNGQL